MLLFETLSIYTGGIKECMLGVTSTADVLPELFLLVLIGFNLFLFLDILILLIPSSCWLTVII